MDTHDFRSSGRVKLSLRRKRIKLDETLTGSRDPGDDSNPVMQGAASDQKDCNQTGTHLETEGLMSSRKLRPTDTKSEPRGLSHDKKLDSQVLCPLCHMDLTNFSVTCRQEHVNKCFEKEPGSERSQQAEEVPAAHVCVLCAKPFKSEHSKLLHMKQCAKRGGISTEALVQLNRVAVESLLTTPLSNQSNCPAVTNETAGDGEMDFKPPLSKARKPKKQTKPTDYLQLVDDDQLQMALALSASIDTRTSSVTTEHQQRPSGKRTRQQKMCDDVIPPLLLTTSNESEKLLAARAEMILIPSEGLIGDEGDIASTQPFPPSRLGQSAPPTSCTKGTSFGDKTHVGGEDCVGEGGEGYSESSHHVVQPSIPSVPRDSKCDWLNQGRDNGYQGTDLQEGSVVDSSALRTEALGLVWSQGCGRDHLEYPTIWYLTSCQNTATMDSFYVPALKAVISPVKRSHDEKLILEEDKHTTDVLASEISPCRLMPSFGGVEQLLADLHGLLGSSSFSDVVMVTRNGARIPSHAVILFSRCPSLRKVLCGSHGQPFLLDLTEFSSESVFGFLEWLYTGSCPHQSPPLQGEVATLVERCLRGEGLAEMCVAMPVSSEDRREGKSMEAFPTDTSSVTPKDHLPQRSSQGSPVLLVPRSFVQMSSLDTTQIAVCDSTQCAGITQPAEQLPLASMGANDVITCTLAPHGRGVTDSPTPSKGCILTKDLIPSKGCGLPISSSPPEGHGLMKSSPPIEGRGPANSPILIDSSASDSGEDGGPLDSGEDGGPLDSGEDGGPLDSGEDGGPLDSGEDGGPLDTGEDGGPLDSGEDGGPLDQMCGPLTPTGRRPSLLPSSPLRIPSSPLRIPSSPLRILSSPRRILSSLSCALSAQSVASGLANPTDKSCDKTVVLANPTDKSCDETVVFKELCSKSCDQESPPRAKSCDQEAPPRARLCDQESSPRARSCDQESPPRARSCDQESPPKARSCDKDAAKQCTSGIHDNSGSTALHSVGSPLECYSPVIHTSRPVPTECHSTLIHTSEPMDLSPSRESLCGVHPAVKPYPHNDSPVNEDCSISVFSSPGKLDTPTSSPVQPSYLKHAPSPVTISSSPSHAPCSPDSHPHTIRLSSSDTDLSMHAPSMPIVHLVMPSSPPLSPSPLPSPPSPLPWSPPPQSPLSPAALPPLLRAPPPHIPSPPHPISSPPPHIPSSPTMDRSTFLHAFEDDVTESEPHLSLGADCLLPSVAVCDHMTSMATPTTCGGTGDNDVTPMPDYQIMRTPALRDQCNKYGVRPLPKRKMIAKLQEIYDYTHPVIDEAIISSSQPAVSKALVAMETSLVASSDEICSSQPTTSGTAKHRSDMNLQELRQCVQEAIMEDQELYRDILMYKPLELVYIQERLKAVSVNVARDKLREMLDQLCITYSCPRPRPPP